MANIDQMIEKKEKRADSLRRQIETASGQLKNLLMEIKVLKYEKLEQVANTEETDPETLIRSYQQNLKFKSRGLTNDDIDELADGDEYTGTLLQEDNNEKKIF